MEIRTGGGCLEMLRGVALSGLCALLFSLQASGAESVSLVRDINILPEGQSVTSRIVVMNGVGYFAGNDGASIGAELWRTDGTQSGTFLVKDINPEGNSSPSDLITIDGTLFFTADDGVLGRELWKSDGTESGTVLVRDIGGIINPSYPRGLTDLDGTLYFSASEDAFSGAGRELWKSDGTSLGTVRVKDIHAGTASSSPDHLTNVNGALFFSADDGVHGLELWKSDGSESGTVLVDDINPGSAGSQPSSLVDLAGTLYFSANDSTIGAELWQSDGTPAGTEPVRDIPRDTARPRPPSWSLWTESCFSRRPATPADSSCGGPMAR